MAEYSNALNGQVEKDGQYLDAAVECNQLAEENRVMKKRCLAISRRFTKAFVLCEDLNNYLRSGK